MWFRHLDPIIKNVIDVELIRNDPEKVKRGIAAKNLEPDLVDRFLELDQKWRDKTTEINGLRARQKKLGVEEIEEAKIVKEEIKSLEEDLKSVEAERAVVLEEIPNLPAEDVPVGRDESDNVVLKEVGEKPRFGFQPRDYLTLVKNLIDTQKSAEVASSRFGYIFGDLVLLEFALIKLALDKLLPQGFIPVIPPVMAKPEIMKGMGKIKFIEAGDAFYLPEDDLYLAGSSEHTIGPLHMNETLKQEELPKRYLGFSTCFRREAGSYGKDTKGILRVHQFDKLEMFSFASPEDSEEEHKFLLARQEELVEALNLPYRIVYISSGDMGFNDYKQYDLEIWLPGEEKYRETHSCSNTTDYQSRGLAIKYRPRGSEESRYLHTLNATAFAIGRMLIAIIENYQTEEGTIIVPELLRDYVGKSEIIP